MDGDDERAPPKLSKRFYGNRKAKKGVKNPK
jgi:hypothetical protein